MNDEEIRLLIDRSQECLGAARDNAAAGRWNRAASDLYYAAFDACRASLLGRGVDAHSHSHARSELNRMYAREGLLSRDDARLYGRLFDLRQEGDYAIDRSLGAEEIAPLLEAVPKLLERLQRLE